MMLGRRTNRDTQIVSRCPKNRRVVTLGATTREHNFANLATQHLGDIVARFVNRLARNSRKPMRPRRVGVNAAHIRGHRLDRLLAHRRARSVI